jgi:hypothetical protein
MTLNEFRNQTTTDLVGAQKQVGDAVHKMRHVEKELSTIGDKETGNVSIKQGGVNE